MSRVSIHQTFHKGTHCFNVLPLLKEVIDTQAGTDYWVLAHKSCKNRFLQSLIIHKDVTMKLANFGPLSS